MRQGDDGRKRKIVRHTELEVYQKAFAVAMELFRITARYPKEERYSLTDQIRRSSRSVAANLAEGWRRRRYSAAFVNKLNECEGEAAESQTWLQFSVECGYLDSEKARTLYSDYDEIIAMLVKMQNHPEKWTVG